MKKSLSLALVLCTLSFGALAGPLAGGCQGMHKGKKIAFSGAMSEFTQLHTGRGSLTVDGRTVAQLDGRDLKLNLILQTFRIRTDHGEIIEGRTTNFIKKTGKISRLIIPAYGINYRDIAITCWTK